MATRALETHFRRMTVEEFLEIEWGDAKVELEDGIVYAMAGGNARHSEIAYNISRALGPLLRGSGCKPYGPDLGIRTGPGTLRYPEISIHCHGRTDRSGDHKQFFDDPKVIVEVLSPSTARHDQTVKAEEYRALPGVEAILFVDPETERVRLMRRTGPGGWADDLLPEGADVELAALRVTLPRDEIFSRD